MDYQLELELDQIIIENKIKELNILVNNYKLKSRYLKNKETKENIIKIIIIKIKNKYFIVFILFIINLKNLIYYICPKNKIENLLKLQLKMK